jgi:hypothetical protein
MDVGSVVRMSALAFLLVYGVCGAYLHFTGYVDLLKYQPGTYEDYNFSCLLYLPASQKSVRCLT